MQLLSQENHDLRYDDQGFKNENEDLKNQV